MSIRSELERLIAAKEAIIEKIRQKGVDVPEGISISLLDEYIGLISGGGGYSPPDKNKDIRLYDYDGSLLYTFSHEELSSLQELPAPPSHDGLTFQGWNRTLDELKTLSGKMNVGAMYITADLATKLIIDIPTESLLDVTLALYQSVSGGVSISWGDGTPSETVSGTGNFIITHSYNSVGEYTISLLPSTGCTLRLGHTSSAYNVMGEVSERSRVYSNLLKAVHLGRRVSAVSSYAFQYCRNLEYITLTDTVTSMGNYSFNNASSLRCVTVPVNVTSIPTYTFGSCYTLMIVSMPKKCITIGASAFRNCYSLSSVTLSSGVTTLNGYAFSECYSLEEVFIPETVTTVGNFVFNKCYSLNKINIPDNITSIGSNAFYQNYALMYVPIPSAATNIGTYAFYDCHALAKVIIPQAVTEIKAYAFYNCYGLKEIYVYPTSPPTFGASGFYNIPDDATIIVPAGTLAAYQSAVGWRDYSGFMREA